MAVKPSSGFRRRRQGVSAFSLIEVVLAIGIIAFALIILFALVPVGLKSNSDSLSESQAVNLLQALIADRQSTAYATNSSLYNLPALSSLKAQTTGTFYLMEDGITTNAQPATARYRIVYTAYPASSLYPGATNYPTSGPPQPVTMNFQASWPAAQTTRPASVETTATFMTP